MILSSTTIQEYVDAGRIAVHPRFDPRQLRPLGIRVHLSHQLLVAGEGQRVDLTAAEAPGPRFEPHDLRAAPLDLAPGAFALGSTLESFQVDRELACRLDGRSTLARIGLLVHCTAELIDGNHGEPRSIVLELANVGPFTIRIGAGYPIGLLTFELTTSPVDLAREQDQYRGQRGVVPPNFQFRTPRYESGGSG